MNRIFCFPDNVKLFSAHTFVAIAENKFRRIHRSIVDEIGWIHIKICKTDYKKRNHLIYIHSQQSTYKMCLKSKRQKKK